MLKQIAIDGPAGAGKSTIARLLAKELAFVYVDTGAMYRAMAIFMLSRGVTVEKAEAAAGEGDAGREERKTIEALCEEADISLRYEPDGQHVLLNGEDVTNRLRTQETGDMASAVSTNGRVRARLVALQQKLAEETPVVMDGRDIGTVVLPAAPLKIYLTATSAERARRRCAELAAKGEETDFETVKREIEARDARDMTRTESPLRKAEDAVEVDSSEMTIAEVTAHIRALWEALGAG